MTNDTRFIDCPACKGDGRIPDATGGGHHGTCVVCRGRKQVVAGTGCDTCPEPGAYEPSEAATRYLACASCLTGCMHGGGML